MADYYVSTSRGNDSTGNGTASTPWKTINKAIGSSPAITMSGSGTDRLYVEPGMYYESVTLGLSPTSGNPLEVVGDCDGTGFVAGGYATPATGPVAWAAWTNATTPSGGVCLSGSTRSYVTLRRLKLYGGGDPIISITTGQSWTVQDCILAAFTNGAAIAAGTAGAPATAGLALVVERCDFRHYGTSGGSSVRITAAETSSEYSLASAVRCCRITGGGGIVLQRGNATGLGALGTGLEIAHCTTLATAGAGCSIYPGVNTTLASPVVIRGCIISTTTGMVAGHTSQVAEDWNIFACNTPRSNVSAGSNSATPLLDLDWEDGRIVGGPMRPFGEPAAGSVMAGFVGSGTPPATDLFGRPRPGGYGSVNAAAGAMERGQAGRKEVTTTDGDGASIAIDGPGVHRFQVPIKSGSNSVTIKARYDSNHGTTNKPRATLRARPECGFTADVTATMTAAAGTWETLTVSYTATSAGWTWLQLESRAAAGNGVAYFDTFSG